MKQKLIHTLVTRFFENNYPEPVCKQFQRWFAGEEDREEKDAALQDVWDSLPDTIELSALDELHKVKQRIHARIARRRRRWMAAAAVILMPLLGLTAKWMFENYQPHTEAAKWAEHFVPDGERKLLTLSDGSTVWLNAGSVLLYPETWDNRTRTLYLSGEARFSVAKDTKRPFVVKTAHIEVEALGTVFSVQTCPGSEKATVTLETGSVRVSDAADRNTSVILAPDEQAVYHLADASITTLAVDAARMNSWTQGSLTFQQESLKRIFLALERKYNVRINYSDSKFSEMTFTVRFHAEDSLEDALDVLRQIGANFRYKITGNDVYIN
jgi:ferric-dicitrate binding protein FerR (iron transport regulator)